MALTVNDVILVAKVSQYLAANDIANGGLFGAILDPRWNKTLYVERKSLEWMNSQDPTDERLVDTAHYVYALCGRYGMRAQQIIVGTGVTGFVITPTSEPLTYKLEYLIPITAADFDDSTNYNNPKIAGKDLQVFWQNANRYLNVGTELIYTTEGFEVFIDDGTGENSFDAAEGNSDAVFKIYIVNPTASVSGTTEGDESGIGGWEIGNTFIVQ